MTCEFWQLSSWIATTLGSIIAVVALICVAVQIWLQRREKRLAALDAMYAELDTDKARVDRGVIYNAEHEDLRMPGLMNDGEEAKRKIVEDTLASLERVAYRVATKQIPSDDAFNLYGGVMLSVAYKLWPFIEDQRDMRRNTSGIHKLEYRRYFESVVRKWIPRYAKALGKCQPSSKLSTIQMLKAVFETEKDH